MTSFDPAHASAAFEAFARSVTTAPNSRAEHESYLVSSLKGLPEPERLEAERMLLEVLRGGAPDVRAVDALTVLGTRSAMDALAELLPDRIREGHASVAVAAIDVLHQKKRLSNEEVIRLTTEAMEHGGMYQPARAVARLLKRVGGKSAWRLLLDMIAELRLGVARADLYESCLDELGVQRVDRDAPGTLATLGRLIGGTSIAMRDAGVAALRPIAEMLAEGKKGAKAGLRRGKGKRAVRAAIKALSAGDAPDLDALSDTGREYVGAWLLGRLPSHVPSHYAALDALKPRHARLVLEELAAWSDEELGECRPLLVSALEALSE